MKIAFMEITSSPRVALIVVAAMFLHYNATAIPTVNLGTASSFAILSASEITDAGGASTIVAGDVGLSPATGAAIGLTPGQVLNGTIYAVDAAGPLGSVNNPALLTTAKSDLNAAFTDASGRTATPLAGADNQLGGKTLFTGVYSVPAASTANLIGTLTLDAQGDPNAVFIIQASSTLVTASHSSVVLINGAQACHVFWAVDSSATLGTYTDFVGNIMAYASVGLNTGATLDGSALAETAAVTLDETIPLPRRIVRLMASACRILAPRCCCSAPDWRLYWPLGDGSFPRLNSLSAGST